jgi:hypothetical protein
MNNIIMFVIGSIIFISYIFFYLRIIIRSHKKELTETSRYDTNDIMAKKTSHKKPPPKATS